MLWKFSTGIIYKQWHLWGAICIVHLWSRISISWFSSKADLEVERLPSTFHQRWIVKLTNPLSPTPSTESAQLARIIYRSISFPLGYLLKIYPFLSFWSVVSGMSMFFYIFSPILFKPNFWLERASLIALNCQIAFSLPHPLAQDWLKNLQQLIEFFVWVYIVTVF